MARSQGNVNVPLVKRKLSSRRRANVKGAFRVRWNVWMMRNLGNVPGPRRKLAEGKFVTVDELSACRREWSKKRAEEDGE